MGACSSKSPAVVPQAEAPQAAQASATAPVLRATIVRSDAAQAPAPHEDPRLQALQAKVEARSLTSLGRSIRGKSRSKVASEGGGSASGGRMPLTEGISPKGMVACYLIAGALLSIGVILSLVQVSIDMEIIGHWKHKQCVVSEPAYIAKLQHGHGGKACVNVPVRPSSDVLESMVVSINANPETALYVPMQLLRDRAREVTESYPVGKKVSCWVSKNGNGKYVKFSEHSWSSEHKGCAISTDFHLAPYVLVVFALIAIYALDLTSVDEFKLAWSQGGYDQKAKEMAERFGYQPPSGGRQGGGVPRRGFMGSISPGSSRAVYSASQIGKYRPPAV